MLLSTATVPPSDNSRCSPISVGHWAIINWESNRTRHRLRFIPKVIEFLSYNPYDPKSETLGERIRLRRESLGLSQKELSAMLGVDWKTLFQWEKGIHQPSKRLRKVVESFLFGNSIRPSLGRTKNAIGVSAGACAAVASGREHPGADQRAFYGEFFRSRKKAATIRLVGSKYEMAKRRRSPVESHAMEPAMCSPSLRLQIVRGLSFVSSLDEKAIVATSSLFREKGFGPGEMICFSNSPATHFYVVVSGLVKLIHQTEEGREVILDLLDRGGFFGYPSQPDQDQYTYSAQALSVTCALAISNRDFQGMLKKYPTVAFDILKVVSERQEFAQATIRRLSVDSVEKRIAAVLGRLGEKYGEKKDVGLLIQLPLSREDLVEMSGTTTETASRVVSDLKRENIIQTGRRWVSVKDFRRLSSIAGREP